MPDLSRGVGVGASAGVHADGLGEADDLLALCHALRADASVQRLVLVGFSFGAFVQARVAHALAQQGPADLPLLRALLLAHLRG